MPSSTLTLKFSGEHNSSAVYTHKYAQKNINSIRHLLGQQINSLGLWESDLRNYKFNNQRYEEGGNMEEKPVDTKTGKGI